MSLSLRPLAFGLVLPLGFLACTSKGASHGQTQHSAPTDAGAAADGDAAQDAGAAQDGAAAQDASAAEDGGGGVEDAAADAGTCAAVATTLGGVLGAASNGACAYEGIPFAAPPLGALRWKPPRPAAAWSTPRPSVPASGCPQTASFFGTASTDEDCLYLNVWVPAAESSSPRPVMVFVHGGAFEWGSGTFGIYDGAKLAAATGNIVVTTNYRLGALGFLSLPALRAEDASHPSAGNYAIEDQAAAFAWVKSNVGAFGGDASNVTIFGESSGGTSMLAHLASPRSQGLFDHVIIESAWAPYGATSISQDTADGYGASFASALGCASTDDASLLACLRSASVPSVLAAVADKGGGVQTQTQTQMGVDWLPVIDQFVLPGDPIARITAGTFNQVPAILGNNANEGSLFALQVAPTSDATYAAAEEAQFPGHGPAVVAEYPTSAYGGSYTNAAAAAMTDGAFLCPARRVARGLAAAGVSTYRYEFTHAIAFPLGGLGAFHGSELLFVFANEIQGTSLQPNELPLSQEMMGYWGAMAATGTPNGGSGLAWPTYAMPAETGMDLDLSLSTVNAYEKAACDFWDGL